MTDIWQFWRDALAGKEQAIDADSPQCGFYKIRDGKDGPWLPVMIRMDGSEMRCRVGDNSNADPFKIWTWCAARPISKEAAKQAFETGSFPGDAPTIGDNSGDVSLVEQLRDYVSGTADWLRGRKIDNKATADQAANRRAEVLRLKGLVEKEWNAKALPHDTVIKALKSEYDAPVKDAESINKALREAATAYAKAEEKRLQDEQNAKHEAARKAAADAAKAMIEERAKQMRDDPIAALTSPEPELPMAPPPPEPVKVALGGQVGKVSGLRSYWEAEITDLTAALTHYANHPDVLALVLKLAKADVKASKGTAKIPGVRGFEDRRVA